MYGGVSRNFVWGEGPSIQTQYVFYSHFLFFLLILLKYYGQHSQRGAFLAFPGYAAAGYVNVII